jgi:hypothetical protein
MRRTTKGKMPVLVGFHEKYDSGHESWSVWCPFCRREHFHGGPAGPRVAHCDDGSPLNATGYVLRAIPRRWLGWREKKGK